MITASEYLTIIKGETGLQSSQDQSILRRLNDLYLQLCGEDDWNWLRSTFSITTVSNQQEYFLNIQNMTVEDVWLEVTATNKRIPMQEIINAQEWDTINNYYANVTSDFPNKFYLVGNTINIFPKSSTAGYTIKVRCFLNPLPMETLDYSTGTIAVTNGDETVTGTGTLWATAIQTGNKIKINRDWYTVSSVTDNTHLELTQKYQGTTTSGITKYKIGDAPLIPENSQSILWKLFCEEYFAKNPAGAKGAVYEKMAYKARKTLDSLSASDSSSNIWDNDPLNEYYRGSDIYIVHGD